MKKSSESPTDLKTASAVPRWSHPRYELIQKIGQGGMGNVYLAEDLLRDGRRVALKTSPDSDHPEALKTEFLNLRSLRHPGIARAFDFGFHGPHQSPFFTMEWISGLELMEYRKQEFSEGIEDETQLLSILDLFLQVASGLAHLHDRDLLHLDLKPSNVLVLPASDTHHETPLAVIIDLGLSRDISAPEKKLRGTLPYMGPEYFKGLPASCQTDVYAFGATLRKMLTGQDLYEVETTQEWVQCLLKRAAPSIPQLPKALDRVLQRCLAKAPTRRFKSGRQLFEALLEVRQSLEGSNRPLFLPTSIEGRLHGREQELKALDSWLESEAQSSICLIVEGPLGSGRSRFLDRVESRLIANAGPEAPIVHLKVPAQSPLEALSRCLRHVEITTPPSKAQRKKYAQLFSDSQSVSSSFSLSDSFTPLGIAWLGEQILTQGLTLILDLDGSVDPTENQQGIPWILRLVQRCLFSRKKKSGKESTGGLVFSWGPESFPLHHSRLSSIQLNPLQSKDIGSWAQDIGIDESQDQIEDIFQKTKGLPLRVSLEFKRVFLASELHRDLDDFKSEEERIKSLLKHQSSQAQSILNLLSLSEAPLSVQQIQQLLQLAPESVEREVRLLESQGWLSRIGKDQLKWAHRDYPKWQLEEQSQDTQRENHVLLSTLDAQDRISLFERAWHQLELDEHQQALESALQAIRVNLDSVKSSTSRVKEVLLELLDWKKIEPPNRRELLLFLVEFALEHGELNLILQFDRELQDLCFSENFHESIRFGRYLSHAYHLSGQLDRAESLLKNLLLKVEDPSNLESVSLHASLAMLFHYRHSARDALSEAQRGIDCWENLSKVEKEHSTQAAIHLWAIKGQAWIRNFEFDRAIESLLQGSSIASTAILEKGLVLNNLGLAYQLANRFKEAQRAFTQAEKISIETADENLRIPVICNIAQIKAKLGRFKAAHQVLARLEDSPLLAMSPRLSLHQKYTQALIETMRLGPSLDTWSAISELAASIGDGFLNLFSKTYQLEALLVSGELSTGERILSELQKIQKNENTLASSQVSRVFIHIEILEALLKVLKGELSESDALQHDQLSNLEDIDSDPLSPWSHYYLALTFFLLQDLEQAEALNSLCLQHFKKTELWVGWLESQLLKSEIHLRRKQWSKVDQALKQLQQQMSTKKMGGEVRGAQTRSNLIKAKKLLLEWDVQRMGPPPLEIVQDILREIEGDSHHEEALLNRLDSMNLKRFLRLFRVQRGSELTFDELEEYSTFKDRDRGFEKFRWKYSSESRRGETLDSGAQRALCQLIEWANFNQGNSKVKGSEALELLGSGWPAEQLRVSFILNLDGQWVSANPEGALFRDSQLKSWVKKLPLMAVTLPLEEPSELTKVLKTGHREVLDWAKTLTSVPWILTDGEIQGYLILFSSELKNEEGGSLQYLERAFELIQLGLKVKHLSEQPFTQDKTHIVTDVVTKELTQKLTQTLSQEFTQDLTRGEVSKKTLPIDLSSSEEFIAESLEMKDVLKSAEQMAQSHLPVLIVGEAGTGKDWVARRIHDWSPRRSQPVIIQNLSSLPPQLFEADLFGAKSGAFTGAERTRTGFLLQAQGGTFILDSIDELSLEGQAKILSVLQNQKVRPLGGESNIDLDIRFVATSKVSLKSLVDSGQFREDLYHRLNTLSVHLPSLRERTEDILPLLRHFFFKYFSTTVRVSKSVRDLLCSQPWTGNVRELEALVQRLGLGMEQDSAISLDLRSVHRALDPLPEERPIPEHLFQQRTFEEMKRELELSYLRFIFRKYDGDLPQIAKALSTSVRSLYRRIEKQGTTPSEILRELGLSPPDTSSD